MKIFVSSLAAILLLAGCGGRTAPTAAESPAQAECRAEARQAPAVMAEAATAHRRVVIGSAASEFRFDQARREAESRAFTDCLRRRGLVRGGGVEQLRQPGF